jgi:hypothetical protein
MNYSQNIKACIRRSYLKLLFNSLFISFGCIFKVASNVGKSFCKRMRLSCIFVQTKLIDVSLLSDNEIEWINNYHQEVWEKVLNLTSMLR